MSAAALQVLRALCAIKRESISISRRKQRRENSKWRHPDKALAIEAERVACAIREKEAWKSAFAIIDKEGSTT